MLCRPGISRRSIGIWTRFASSGGTTRLLRCRPRKELSVIAGVHKTPDATGKELETDSCPTNGQELGEESEVVPRRHRQASISAKDPKQSTSSHPADAQRRHVLENDARLNEKATVKGKRPTRLRAPRLVLIEPSPNHHDMASFLDYASRADLKMTTNVYKGTYYEYLVAEALKRYNFVLHRTGQTNDLGIDLIGHWHLPQKPHELKVLIQCKATKPTPAMIRELEGTYVGAPVGWRGEGVLGVLVASYPATEGVRAAIQRSRLSLCFVQITPTGNVRQFLWNSVAKESRLTGMSVTMIYNSNAGSTELKGKGSAVREAVSLLWMGRHWKGEVVGQSDLQGRLISKSEQLLESGS